MTIPSQFPDPEQPGRREFLIPTIDISPYITNPNSAESSTIIAQIRNACVSTGFFQLTGHGIAPTLQESIFTGAEALFKLPQDEKKKMDKTFSISNSNRGYELLGSQGLEAGTLPDLKEGFYIGHEVSASDPRVEKGVFLVGPNVWPDEALLPAHVFREPMERYHKAMYELCLVVLDLIARGLPYGDDVFEEFKGKGDEAVANLRLLHYPPDRSGDERQLGAGAHTDFGAITLLLQDQIGGLQVWDGTAGGKEQEGNGVWRDVPPNKDAYVVNIGDMLQMWTSGRYKSSLHRVVNRSGKDRYSLPFFFDGSVDCLLSPLGGEEVAGGGKALTVEEHMRERFGSTYSRGKKE